MMKFKHLSFYSLINQRVTHMLCRIKEEICGYHSVIAINLLASTIEFGL